MKGYTIYGGAFMVAHELVKYSVEIIARESYSDNEDISGYISRGEARALIDHLRKVFKFGVRVRIEGIRNEWRYVKNVLHDQILTCRDRESAYVFTDPAELAIFEVARDKYGLKFETESVV